MSLKTICEDVFRNIYLKSLRSEEAQEKFEQYLKKLENIVHSMRLYYYLTLIAKELSIPLPSESDFSENFQDLLREVLKEFYKLEEQNFPQLSEEEFVETIMNETKFELGTVEDYIENVILLLLGYLVDKNLSEVYVTTKIKNIIKELKSINKRQV
jgi:hypothetical protein